MTTPTTARPGNRVDLKSFVRRLPDGMTTEQIITKMRAASKVRKGDEIDETNSYSWGEIYMAMKAERFVPVYYASPTQLRAGKRGNIRPPTYERERPGTFARAQ